MPRLILLLLVTFGISLLVTWLLVRFSRRLPFLKKPTSDRWHKQPTPDSGGIAIFVTLLVAYLIGFQGLHRSLAWACAGLWLLGTLDDRFRLNARTKFVVQGGIIALVVASGVVFQLTSIWIVNLAFTWLWLVGITNAFNLIDNMDGLAAGVAVIIALFRAALLLDGGYLNEAALCAAIGAAFLGFLFFNFNPARIFMGDGGSLVAGFSLAALTVVSPLPHTRSFVIGLFYPALTFAYPIFDTTVVSILRRAAGRPVSVGGRDHTSHRLASVGIHERHVVLILWAFTAVGSAIGVLLHLLPFAASILVFILVVFATMFATFLATLPMYPFPSRAPVGRLRLVRRWLPSLRAAVSVLVDASMASIGVVGAFVLRFDFSIPDAQSRNLFISIPVVFFTYALVCTIGRSYERLWYNFEIDDVWPFFGVAAAGTSFSCAVLFLSLTGYPRSVLVLYPILTLGLTVSIRSFLRLLRHTVRGDRSAQEHAVAIFGANDRGKCLARYLKVSSTSLVPVAFLEDDSTRHGGRFCGLPVVTLDRDLERRLREMQITKVLLASGGDLLSASVAHSVFQRASVDIVVAELQLTVGLSSATRLRLEEDTKSAGLQPSSG